MSCKSEETNHVLNGKHKWKDSIDHRFDKLVALVEHQIEPHKPTDTLTRIKETEIKLNGLHKTINIKRNIIPEPTKSNKFSNMNGNHLSDSRNVLKRNAKELVAPKSPDTPPRTPSPSVSLERPLTPQTPGLSPASTPTIIMNAHNDRSALVSPACSTSSKASSVDSHSSKQKSGKSGRSKHKTSHTISGLTASYNLPVTQNYANNSNNSHALNWDNTYNESLHSNQVQQQQQQQQQYKSHLNLFNSSKTSPQIPFNSYQMPFSYQRNGKSSQNYPNVTSNQSISPLVNNYSSFESNPKHSNYSNSVPNAIDYQRIPPNNGNDNERQSPVVGKQPLPSNNMNQLYSSAPMPVNTNHNNNNHYRSQLNGHFGHHQQKLLRPSRLDAVLIKKDYSVGQLSPQYETGI